MAVAELRILQGRSELDGLLEVGRNLGVYLIRRAAREILRFSLQRHRNAIEDLGQVEVVPGAEEINLAQELILGVFTAPLRDFVDILQRVVGAVDTGIAAFPQRFHPAEVGVHQTVDTLGADVGLAAAAQTVVGGDVEDEERILLRVGEVHVHHGIDAGHHLVGILLVDREVFVINFLDEALRFEEFVTPREGHQAKRSRNQI